MREALNCNDKQSPGEESRLNNQPEREHVDMYTNVDIQARDPEDREVKSEDRIAKREKMMDKTIADSFPASDPPSSLPDPNEDSFSREIQGKSRRGKTKQLTITT